MDKTKINNLILGKKYSGKGMREAIFVGIGGMSNEELIFAELDKSKKFPRIGKVRDY